ncbi:aminotransferase class I/II-fold pyridoxal phosphate-dependent enzyme, partial [Kingella kingae]|uniref:aminotransferase class I/II-fold pyridoxal phosphate-dependent enzyme n=1 Tax=Kingella kingae TaxID=504 RepID=UPI002556A75E
MCIRDSIDTVNQNIATLTAERERVSSELAALEDVTVFDSQANFVTVRLPNANTAFEKLKQNKILVKNLHGSHSVVENCLRLTIGTPEQNDEVLRVLRNVIAEHLAQKYKSSGEAFDLSTMMFYIMLIYNGVLSLLSLVLGLSFGHI